MNTSTQRNCYEANGVLKPVWTEEYIHSTNGDHEAHYLVLRPNGIRQNDITLGVIYVSGDKKNYRARLNSSSNLNPELGLYATLQQAEAAIEDALGLIRE